MSKLCAPVRDDEIAALRNVKDVVPLFKGIMKANILYFVVIHITSDYVACSSRHNIIILNGPFPAYFCSLRLFKSYFNSKNVR